MNDKKYFDLMQRAQRCRKLLNGAAIKANLPHRKICIDTAYCHQTVKEHLTLATRPKLRLRATWRQTHEPDN